MAFSPRTVLIPLAGAARGAGRVARVQADGTRPSRNEARLNPQISELADWHLYEAGAIALGAVKRLQLPPKRLALLQRLRPGTISAYLSVTNGPDIVGLHSENTESAELGLALATLAYVGQSRANIVIATGRLARNTAPTGSTSDDIEVLAVGEIGKKIETMRNAPEMYKGGAYPSRLIFFMPQKTLDGRDTLEEHATDIKGLVESFRELGTHIEVCPIASLHEALSKLGVRALEVAPADRLFTGALASAALCIALAVSAWGWLNAPLKLEFSEVSLDNGENVASPVRAVFDIKKRKYLLQEVCHGPQRLSVFRSGDSLVLRVSAAEKSRLAALWDGYEFAVVTVSENSGIKVFSREAFQGGASQPAVGPEIVSAARDERWSFSVVLPIEGPAEKNKVIVLARRLGPFDPSVLRRGLEAAIAGKPPTERINAAVTYLAKRAPGYLDYSFLSSEAEPPCSPS